MSRFLAFVLLALSTVSFTACFGPSGPQGTGLSPTLVTPPPQLAATLAQPAAPVLQEVQPVSFSKEIMPLFKALCAACHIEAETSGLSLKDHKSLLRGGRNGLAVIIGNPDLSLLVRVLKGTEPALLRMPPDGPDLTDAEIQKISDWIRQGAPNN